MATARFNASAAALRAITYRISSTPTEQLPGVASQIAGQLWRCQDLLAASADQLKQAGDAAVLVHKFKTHLSTLLQDRTVHGRWVAVVLVKATIEAGGVETLSKSNAWVRNLLGILKKPDPPTTRTLAVIALTRIFMLTWDHANLIREITTPALPAFVGTCLNNAESKRCSPAELQTILEAFIALVPRHLTTFRTNESNIRALATAILSSTSSGPVSGSYFTQVHRDLASRLLVLLHNCTPKQGSAAKWDESLKSTVAAAHATCDRIFRSVLEDWESTAGVQNTVPAQILFKGIPELEENDNAGLTGWKGIFSGSERLVTLLELLQAHLDAMTAAPVTLRLGQLTDLLIRIFSVAPPRTGVQDAIKSNSQISKDERDAMYTVLPRIHVAALNIVQTLLTRYANIVISIMQPLLTQIAWVFQAEASDPNLRSKVYTVLQAILLLRGQAMMKDDVSDIEPVMKFCCDDLAAGKSEPAKSLNASGLIPRDSVSNPSICPTLLEAARNLLPILCGQLDPATLSTRVRIQLERTAILIDHRDALVTCVLNPTTNGAGRARSQPSLLPILARRFPEANEVEALLRPRMPAIRQKVSSEIEEDDEDDDDAESVAERSNAFEMSDGPFNTSNKDAEHAPDVLEETIDDSQSEDVGENIQVHHVAKDLKPQAVASEKRNSPSNEGLGQNDDRPEKRLRVTPAEVPASNSEHSVANGRTSPSIYSQANTVPTVASMERGEEDDSDFEMPVLTMESDTEDEG
ncbi:Hypothetical protein R9X50_00022900 [Acrodontium crateriforme]|uniref:Pre-rRNA-processing protein RIX1 n=1 Tax=Acrodontium crateriforme TaxID=150365 RepID=A0AAQ3LYF1_9PEZI|nr:Hypothetical protein R9X50_00022900 [Acrodontium crateriforme]